MDPNLFDNETFNQLLSLDEDEMNHEFSKNLVVEFFSQAQKTIDEMEAALQNDNLKKIKELGHFLKGSSAQLGLKKVQLSSQRIQELQEENENIKHLEALIKSLKTSYADTSAALMSFYRL